jgi:hypothetical protein
MKHQLSSPVTVLFKTFPSSSIISTNSTVDAGSWFFDPALTNEEQNEHTLFSNLRVLPYVLSLYGSLSFLLISGHSKFDLRPNTFEWLPSILLFWKLKDGLSFIVL